ncbi:hypothetical protein niasHS_015606 [Heterodera schachtii]|uniref:Uncharacterized protein n=1 Tax=Heterodera schachtii TaxID=97005 RepID=A0ABD2HXX7_HETSC
MDQKGPNKETRANQSNPGHPSHTDVGIQLEAKATAEEHFDKHTRRHNCRRDAWISERCIEHLHHVLNKQSELFMRYKGDELLLKIGEHQTLLNSIFDRQIGFL